MHQKLYSFYNTTISSLFVILICSLSFFACKTTPEEIKQLKSKALQAEQQLQIAVENKKDVSKVAPKMKQVKVLADNGKIKQADTLLDEILLDFKNLNAVAPGINNIFVNPRRVNIVGNSYSAMEPFITRDGSILFFNSNKNDTPETEKNIYYATRIDDTTFKYMGEVKGINSNKVDGVPTMDNDENFYFVSTAHYNKENHFATVYKGKFKDGEVKDISAIPELSLNKPGWLNMDIEISADGSTIYATQTLFGNSAGPKESYFFTAHLEDGKFKVDENSNETFKYINTDNLEYAASISTDELEIFFTRLKYKNGPKFSSYYASRSTKTAPFGKPLQIEAITGFSEAPAITHDGRLVYFHKNDGGQFYIYVLERVDS